MAEYSVLMSVYHKENPDFFRQSLESIANQTIKTDDFVLVCDGPLTDELDSVIYDYIKIFGSILNVIRLPENGGLGKALNTGMKYCKNDFVARMDSDDISFPARCGEELSCIVSGGYDIVGAGVQEFDVDIGTSGPLRLPPETSEEILLFAKKRNPFNHPVVMFRKSSVIEVGGYQDFYYLEDYYLWIRMLKNGAKGYNIQKPLLWMRAGSDMYKRRSGFKYAKSQCKLFRYMKKNGFIGIKEYCSSVIIRSLSSLAPNSLRTFMFKKVLRK